MKSLSGRTFDLAVESECTMLDFWNAAMKRIDEPPGNFGNIRLHFSGKDIARWEDLQGEGGLGSVPISRYGIREVNRFRIDICLGSLLNVI